MDIELAKSGMEVRLDLACGQNVREGFTGVDFYAPGIAPENKVNLFKFPYPWADNSVDELHCSHFVEHLPARALEDRDIHENTDPALRAKLLDKDFLFAFFDECYRVLKPGARISIIVPSGKSVRGFQDPTHRRFIMQETFLYLAKEWRDMNKLDHYNVYCDFGLNVTCTCATELTVRHPEYQAHAFRHFWDAAWDYHALLTKK